MMIASDTAAREISDSDIVPVAEWTILIFTSSLESFPSESLSTSMEPCHIRLDNMVQFFDFSVLDLFEQFFKAQSPRLGQFIDVCVFIRCMLTCLALFSSSIMSPVRHRPEVPRIAQSLPQALTGLLLPPESHDH